jgi:hypothetical protein
VSFVLNRATALDLLTEYTDSATWQAGYQEQCDIKLANVTGGLAIDPKAGGVSNWVTDSSQSKDLTIRQRADRVPRPDRLPARHQYRWT